MPLNTQKEMPMNDGDAAELDLLGSVGAAFFLCLERCLVSSLTYRAWFETYWARFIFYRGRGFS